MKALFFSIALFLGVSVQVSGHSSKNISHSLVNILLQAKASNLDVIIPVIALIIIIIVFVVSVLSDSNKQGEIPSVGDWLGRFIMVITLLLV